METRVPLLAEVSEGFGGVGLFFGLLPRFSAFFQRFDRSLRLLQGSGGKSGVWTQCAAQICFFRTPDNRAIGVVDQQLFVRIAAQLAD